MNALIKVLLVEDDEDDYIITRDLITDIENKKFQLFWVANYDLALESLVYKKFDVVLIDYHLGDRTGLELLQAAQQAGCKLPMILLTGQGDYFVDTEAMKAGASDYLIKGQINAQLLERAIRYAIERKQSEEALRQSEEKLKAALFASGTGTLRWDIWTNCLEWDDNLDLLLGLPVGQVERNQATLLSIIHPEDRDLLLAAVEQCAREGADLDIEFRIIWPDGSIRWLANREKMFFDSQGKPLYMTGACMDITARKHAEMEREQLLEREQKARADAEAANRIKDEFLAVLSHELRTPINLVLGWAELLRSRKLDEVTANRALETIQRNAKLQTQLIEDLLDISRILRGKLSLKIAAVNLAAAIEAAIETVSLAVESKNIDLQYSILPNIQVLGDTNRLQQVIWNLLSNAVKFTPTGGKVAISLSVSNDGKNAEIKVQDTGKGIEPEFLPYVFDSFRQADSTSTRSFGGLGLGLAIVKHLVELHGGTVIAVSAGEDKGSTFTVYLPVLVSNANEENPNAHTEEVPNLIGTRILVVDDEAETRELITFTLEKYGARVESVGSAQEALQVLNNSQHDLLLSDIGMPDLNGYMLIRQIRQSVTNPNTKIPAIALTAYASELDAQQAIAAGFNSHIAKPVEPIALASAVARLINSHKSN